MDFQIWAEKYRPSKLSDIINQKHAVERIKAFVKDKNIPHMLFAGPAGTGKTTTALAIAKELYGNTWRQNVLEMNASDERGIDVIRGKVKDFARMKPLGEIPWKIIILDEADALTQEAQQALRRTMENYTNVTRFILLCVSPDTKILLQDEVETPIANLKINTHKIILGLNIDSFEISEDNVVNFIEADPKIIDKQCLILKTSTGRKLKLTEEHPILTKGGWKPAKMLTKDDYIAVFPNLEGTQYSNKSEVILDVKELTEFITLYEMEKQKKQPLGKAKSFDELITTDKEKIRDVILGLYKVILAKIGLTKREMKIWEIIKNSPMVSRLEIQNKIELSRIRVVQLLKELEKKGFVERTICPKNKKLHFFTVTNKNPMILRNLMDIRKEVIKRFCLDISYSTIKNLIRGECVCSTLKYVLDELKSKNLLPLYSNSEKIGILARLIGFLFGDGHLTKSLHRLIFTSNENTLTEVKNDISKLGYKPSKTRIQRIKGEISGRKFVGRTASFYVQSTSLWLFLRCLGVPVGDKVLISYEVPKWVRKGNKYIKREFLRGFLDAEANTPVCKKRNFGAISVSQNKLKELVKNSETFLNQIAELLREFHVETYHMSSKPSGTIRKHGMETYTTTIALKASDKNMFNFFRQIGFFYEKNKRLISRYANEYLRYKLHAIEKRKKLGMSIATIAEYSDGTIAELSKKYETTADFVKNQVIGKDVGILRDFPTFAEWKNEYVILNSELVWNRIEDIKEIELDQVIDITCQNNHNFVANGIISHNCNYSSKIIDPIQSRCAVFRFKSLTDTDIKKYIERIANGEKLKIDSRAVDALVYLSEGDLRKIANLLQASAAMREKITEDVVYDVASRAKPTDVKEMLELVLKGKFVEARKKLQEMLLRQGLSGSDIISEIHRQIYSLDGVPEQAKVQMIEKCGEYEFRLSEGGNEVIQLESLLASFLPYSKVK